MGDGTTTIAFEQAQYAELDDIAGRIKTAAHDGIVGESPRGQALQIILALSNELTKALRQGVIGG